MDIKVPRIAENISGGIVATILVKKGDSVKKDQTVVELDTEKAVAAVPSPHDGTIQKILVKVGDNVRVGQTLVTLITTEVVSQQLQKELPKVTKNSKNEARTNSPYIYQSPSGLPPPASPTVRKLTQDLGLDLTLIHGSEHGGRVIIENVKRYIQQLQNSAKTDQLSPDFSTLGSIKKEKAGTIRQKIAEKMTLSWTTIPHVTQFDEADITNLLALRKKELLQFEAKSIRPTVTGYVLKILVPLLKKHRKLNASYNIATQEIIYKDYINLGIAVDTEQGLIVPVIKNIDTMDLATISKELEAVADKARKRTLSLKDIQGASFTISNQGGIGGNLCRFPSKGLRQLENIERLHPLFRNIGLRKELLGFRNGRDTRLGLRPLVGHPLPQLIFTRGAATPHRQSAQHDQRSLHCFHFLAPAAALRCACTSSPSR